MSLSLKSKLGIFAAIAVAAGVAALIFMLSRDPHNKKTCKQLNDLPDNPGYVCGTTKEYNVLNDTVKVDENENATQDNLKIMFDSTCCKDSVCDASTPLVSGQTMGGNCTSSLAYDDSCTQTLDGYTCTPSTCASDGTFVAGTCISHCSANSTKTDKVADEIVACTGGWTSPGIEAGATALCGSGMQLCEYDQIEEMTDGELNTCKALDGFFATSVSGNGGYETTTDGTGKDDIFGCGNDGSADKDIIDSDKWTSKLPKVIFSRYSNDDGWSIDSSQDANEKDHMIHSENKKGGVMCCPKTS